MAIIESPTKSIVTLLGIAVAGAIFVVATAVYRNRVPEVTFTSKPYAEPESGMVFDAPLDWKVGMGSNNYLQVRGLRIEKLPNQKDQCMATSQAISTKIEQSLAKQAAETTKLWQDEFPGLAYSALLTSQAGEPVLIGIDTCNASFNRKTIVFRGQTYRDDIEVRFTTEFVVDTELTQSELDQTAKAIAQGTSEIHQAEFTQFRAVLGSVR